MTAKLIIAIEKDGTEVARQQIDLSILLSLDEDQMTALVAASAALCLMQAAPALDPNEPSSPPVRPTPARSEVETVL